MRRTAAAWFLYLMASTVAQPLFAQSHFAAIDVYLDTGNAHLAAWQFELSEDEARMQVVGIENGEHEAFDEPPHYDRETLHAGKADRVVVADFSLAPAGELPRGSTRIATVHLRIEGEAPPEYHIQLIAAGDAQGKAIPAQISIRKK